MWRKSECGAVEGWHEPFITPEWIKEDRDTSFWLWPSHPELTPALTSRRSSPPRVTMQTTPTQHKHQSRKRDKWQWGAEWHPTGPRREEAGGRNHLDSSQLQELAFKKGRGGNPPPKKTQKLIWSSLFLFFSASFSNHYSPLPSITTILT